MRESEPCYMDSVVEMLHGVDVRQEIGEPSEDKTIHEIRELLTGELVQ